MRICVLDPGPVLRELRRLMSSAQDDALTGVVRLVGAIPVERLELVLRTPVRRLVLDAVFWGLPHALGQTPAHEFARSVRFHITGREDGGFDAYWAHYDGRWHGGRGEHAAPPELTITVDALELLMLVSGRSNPLRAYLAGRLRASGNPILAARLAVFLRTFVMGASDAAATR